MVLHVRFDSLYISLPSSAKRQREMTKFYVFWNTRAAMANFSCLPLELNTEPEQDFRPIGELNRST